MDQQHDIYIKELVERYMNNTCSRAEMDEVLVLADKDPLQLYNALKEHWLKLEPLSGESRLSADTVIEQAGQMESFFVRDTGTAASETLPGRSGRAGLRRWIGIAASVIVAIGIAVYLFTGNPNNQSAVQQYTDVAAPASSRATVKLANGETITLDSLLSGTIAVQEDGKLIKNKNGQLVYQAQPSVADHTPVYNTLDNPKGSKVVDITLADGTQVWLNAGSSITFPVAFTGTQRIITLKGEAYLDVSHDAKKPFIVQTGDLSIKVLGTGFNVNAYQDAEPIKVTLLKGSVALFSKGANRLLKPGQQASIKGQISINNNIDVDEVLAWKNNRFVFDNCSIQQVMRQLEQWYDIEVAYEGAPTREAFVGSISRDVSLSQILSLLSETNAVRFEQQAKKVIVKK